MLNRNGLWKIWGLSVVPLLAALPALANPSNFGNLSLAPGFGPSSGQVDGHVKGAIALHQIVGSRDMHNNLCLGYGSPNPDHLLVLRRNFAQLKLQVNSQNRDTTLLIKGPGKQLYCLDDSAQGQDAGWVANNLPAGTYQVWVGSFERGSQFRYTLTAQEF